MFVTSVDLLSQRGAIDHADGIAALALDPSTDLDVALFNGATLRPGGLWLPPGGRPASSVVVTPVRRTHGLQLRECSQMQVQVFEPGDVLIAPPRRVSKVYDSGLVTLTAATPTFVMAIPFTGRRAAKVAVRGPSGAICTVDLAGRLQTKDGTDVVTKMSAAAGDTFTTSAAPAAWASGSAISGKLAAQTRYYGGTDSLTEWDELHVFANSDMTGSHWVVVEVSDEVNG